MPHLLLATANSPITHNNHILFHNISELLLGMIITFLFIFFCYCCH